MSLPPLYTNRDMWKTFILIQTVKHWLHQKNDSYSRVCFVLPAHDLMGQQDPAHLWIFILAFVDNRLKQDKRIKIITVIYIFMIGIHSNRKCEPRGKGKLKKKKKTKQKSVSVSFIWEQCCLFGKCVYRGNPVLLNRNALFWQRQ